MAQKKNRRNAIIAALAVLVVALAVGGTIAWLTAQDQLTNQFTVGSIDKPDKPSDPDEGNDDDKDEDDEADDISGYLFETEWIESKTYPLTQGVAQAKNPNVGIGKGTAEKHNDAYVFLYVENNSLASGVSGDENLGKYAPYFYLEKQWSPVTESVISGVDSALPNAVAPVTSDPGAATDVATAAGHDGQTAYVDGLFMYTGEDAGTVPQILVADGTSSNTNAVYTGELFEDITVPNDLDGKNVQDVLLLEGGNIEVHAFIYAANSNPSGDGSAQQALKEAIIWANDIASA